MIIQDHFRCVEINLKYLILIHNLSLRKKKNRWLFLSPFVTKWALFQMRHSLPSVTEHDVPVNGDDASL